MTHGRERKCKAKGGKSERAHYLFSKLLIREATLTRSVHVKRIADIGVSPLFAKNRRHPAMGRMAEPFSGSSAL
jgi:hypothetical protein